MLDRKRLKLCSITYESYQELREELEKDTGYIRDPNVNYAQITDGLEFMSFDELCYHALPDRELRRLSSPTRTGKWHRFEYPFDTRRAVECAEQSGVLFLGYGYRSTNEVGFEAREGKIVSVEINTSIHSLDDYLWEGTAPEKPYIKALFDVRLIR